MVRSVTAWSVAAAALVGGLTIAPPAHAAEQAIFGPATYTRTAGPPNTFVDSFALPATLIAPFRLHVQNGNPDGTHRISSATITLNGVQVAGPSDFLQQIAGFDKTISLQANNTLQVHLTSAPGSYLVITVFSTVPPPTLTSLLPPTLPITQGATGTLTATITPVQPVPTTITLSSDNTNVASVPATATVLANQTTVGIPVTGVAPGSATITASLNGTNAHSTVTVAPAGPTITSLLPATLQVTQGASGTLTVTISAAQATDTLVNLITSDGTIVTLPPTGSVTVLAGQTLQAFAVFSVAPGSATITASLSGTSAQSQVTVVTPLPTVVSLLPPVLPLTEGSSGTLTVTLNATQPTDTDVGLSTSDATIVGLPPGNKVTVPAHTLSAGFPAAGLKRGMATVTASLNGTSATAAIEVQPPPPMVQALTCPATLTTGAVGQCTVTLNATQLTDTAVPLASNAPGTASVPPSVTAPANQLTANFAVTGVAASATPATITAGPLNGTSQTASVQVVPPPPTIVSLLPTSASIFVGATANLTLTLNAAQLSDTSVPLASNAPGTASVPPGVTVPAGSLTATVVVTGVAPGPATITAGPLNGTQAQSTISVNQLPPTVTGLAPAALSLPKGKAGTLTVTIAPTQPDPTVVPLTSNDPSVGVPPTVTVPAGASSAAFPVLANNIGSATITAGPLNGTSQQATVTVTPPELVSLAVTPLALSLAKGATQQFTATGTFTDASTQDVTGSAAWTSSDTSVATITSPGGVAIGVGQGSAQITAAVGAILSPPATLTVTPPVLVALAVSPTNPTRDVGQTLQFQATGTLTDGTTQDLTAAVSWTSSDPTVATITSPGGLATALAPGPTTITATHAASGLIASTTLTVAVPPPTVSRFTPTSGRVGDPVTITGTNFVNVSAVAFNGVAAPGFSVMSATSIQVNVPTGATTGPLSVTTAAGRATSGGSFVVIPTRDFQLTALPTTVNVPAAGQGTFTISLTGSGGFTGLTTLAVSGVPTGGTALFASPSLTAGQNTLLTLTTNGTTAAGSYPLTVTTTGLLNGIQTTRSASLTLQVQAAGQTSLTGQVLDEDAMPVKGATVKLGTLQTTTDDAGNFLLLNPPVGAAQLLLIDGGPASSPGKSLPIIPYKVTIVAGQANTLGFTPYLHAQKTTGLVDISNSSVQRVVTDLTLPGYQMTIPAGVTITGWDGQPNRQVSVRRVATDRAPLPPFPADRYSPTLFMYYFGKQGGGTPSAPVPITYPNDLDIPPGTPVELWFYDEAPDGSRPNAWAQYGTGTVSADGSQVLPDTDPSTGQPFGQPRFCCGAGRIARSLAIQAALNALRGGQAEAAQPTPGGEPVNLSTGSFTLAKTDLVLPGRLPIVFTRLYRTNGAAVGPFGPGTSHPYHILLLLEQNLRTVLLPTGARLAFPRQADGTFRNFTDPAVRGAVITGIAGGSSLRFKDGTTWTFNSLGFLTAQTDRNGNTLSLTYDASFSGPIGKLVAITEPSGRQVTLTQESVGVLTRITSITDPIGRTVTYAYDASGRLASVTDPAGGVTSYTYDSQGRMLNISDPRGITYLTNTYDANGRVRQQTQADGGVWQFAYTVTAGVVTQTVVTDPRGNPTTYRFNGQGYPLSTTDALGQSTTFTRDPSTNLLLTTTDPLGRVTRFTYDAAGNVTSLTGPAGNVRTFTYEPAFNSVTSVTDHLGNITRFGYDPTNGNLLTITDPLGGTTQMAYNGFGQPVSRTDPLGNMTTFAYNGQGDLVSMADPLGNTWSRVYDQVSRVTARIDPRGRQVTFGYDPLNRPLSIVDPLGATTAFSYDSNGNLLRATDARGNTVTFEYDSMDRRIRRIDPLGGAETYRYDLGGNVIESVDRKAQPKTYTYDPLNRRIGIQFADGTGTLFTYNGAGLLVQADDATDPRRPISRSYDVLDRLLAESTTLGTVTYQYDLLGRRIQMTVAGQAPVTYTYDATSRLRTVTQAPLNPVDIQYDALGRRTLLTLPNGITTAYHYDAASRLMSLIYRNAATVLSDLQYSYDAGGSRISLSGSLASTLLPDPVSSTSYDAANRQLTAGAKTMTYDSHGNLASLTEPSGTTTFIWDARNRLIALNGPGESATFAYDGVGRRAQKTLNGQRSDFQYDIANTISELRAGSPVTYLRGLSVDELFGTTDGSGTRHSTTDALGSILQVTDNSGAIQADYRYGPFGQTQRTGPDGANVFQFTGRENDGTGLYYYRFRYYSPTLNRFISEDPFRPLAGSDSNLYLYVGNSPMNAVDPFGLYNDDVHLNLTYCLALHAGFTTVQAGRIAARDILIDYDPETAPMPPLNVQARRDWHFTTPERRLEAWNIALEGSLEDLGNYLHALQDSYSHETYGPIAGHWPDPRPDLTHTNPERANRMARDTNDHLRTWIETRTGQQQPDRFAQIRDEVDRFNRARTGAAKARYLSSWCRL